jgi:hypothetical protein
MLLSLVFASSAIVVLASNVACGVALTPIVGDAFNCT